MLAFGCGLQFGLLIPDLCLHALLEHLFMKLDLAPMFFAQLVEQDILFVNGFVDLHFFSLESDGHSVDLSLQGVVDIDDFLFESGFRLSIEESAELCFDDSYEVVLRIGRGQMFPDGERILVDFRESLEYLLKRQLD